MENRFGLKDFLLFGLVTVLIVLVLAAMWQYDRQWNDIALLKRQNADLAGDTGRITADLGRIRRQLDDGLTLSPGTKADATSANSAANSGATSKPAASGGVPPVAGMVGNPNDPFRLVKAAEKQPDYSSGDWYITNFGAKIGKLTPLVSSDVYQAYCDNLVMGRLAVRDPYSLDYVPLVARNWEISPDGLTMTFHLKEGITFSDGTPLTAEDVVFTFDWMRNPDVDAARARSGLDKLDTVTAPDPMTVVFKFTETYFQNFDVAAGTSIMSKKFYGGYTPAQFNDSVGLLFGCGPYMLESPTGWTPGNGVTLVRNPRYWGEPPAFDRIIFREIEEEGASMVVFGNGQMDVVPCSPEMFEKLGENPRIKEMARPFVYDTPYGGYSYIGWNQERTKNGVKTPTRFADARVRRAMTMLIDRERIAREIYKGYASVANGPFSPQGPQSDPDVKAWPYDPEAALKLLAEAGYEDRDGDGVLEDREGRPFTFTLTYSTNRETTEKIVRFLKDSFSRGKIVMNVEPLQWSVLVNKLNQGDYEAITLGWSSSIESDPYQIFDSSQIKDGGDNRINYSNPELDKVIEKARVTLDVGERMKMWHRVHQILHEDQPYTFMLSPQSLKWANNRIGGINESKVGLNWEMLNSGVVPWYVAAGQQKYTQ